MRGGVRENFERGKAEKRERRKKGRKMEGKVEKMGLGKVEIEERKGERKKKGEEKIVKGRWKCNIIM